MRFQELLGGVRVLELRGDASVDVSSLAHDSRDVRPGACFACIPGAVTDGHDHAPSAVDAGAVALLVERPLALGVAEAQVASVREVLGPAAARLHGDPSRSLRVLGVTGTNGKTTVTHLLEAISTAAGESAGVIGTVGARYMGVEEPVSHTTPEADELQSLLADMRDSGVRTVAMEVSSHALAQHRVDGTAFAAACFTNLSQDHLDYHSTMDEYFAAKAALFTPRRTAVAVVNADDPYGRDLAAMLEVAQTPLVTFAMHAREADVVATDIVATPRGMSFRLADRRTGDEAAVDTSRPGRFNVSNALAAAATAIGAGLSFDAVVAGLQSNVDVPGRLERVDAGQPFTVLVDYAHTPDALAHALEAARDLAGDRRVVVVFGCGGDRDPEKRPLMGRAAGHGADLVVLTSDNPRSEDPASIAAAARRGLDSTRTSVVEELDRRLAIRRGLDAASEGDVVLIAGKGHETGQTTAGVTLPFDDRAVAREELEARRCD